MQQISVRQQIEKRLDSLPKKLQCKVLDYVTNLDASGLPPGVPGKELLHFAGSLSFEDAEELNRIIEDGCERRA